MHHTLLLGKTVLKLSKSLKKGAGSTWPGHIALKTDGLFIKKILSKNPHLKIVFIAGTNGKTTTTKAFSHILNLSGISTIQNNAGANLINGLASNLIQNATLMGSIKQDVLLFEVDENALPLVLKEIPNPDAIILLNLFRDQLDRYGEVNSTAEKWNDALSKLSEKTVVIANADDPQITHIANFAKNKLYYTIDNKFKNEKELSHAVDSTTCPKCRNPLRFTKISYSHLGNYTCTNCNFKNPDARKYDIKTNLFGIYNLYNISSAVLTAEKVFGIEQDIALNSIQTFTAAFGRQEIIDIDGKKVMLLLSKNPTGFNESLKVAVKNNSSVILILLNDRIPDGRDVSWIWDVDFEILQDLKIHLFVSGDRPYEMSQRLAYANVPNEVNEKFKIAYHDALEKTPKSKTLTILPTYSAMLEVRKLIFGRSIL